jgi:hypothetical protein
MLLKMKRSTSYINSIPPAILFLSLLAVYLRSIAPGLTWANSGSDGGDLIAAAATGGVAHPTGYPLYLALARLFQWLPIGSLAFRTNLLSTLSASAAALVVYKLVTRYLPAWHGKPNWLAGIVSGYAFGLSPLVWSQAVITEVYALHALFVALILFLASFDTTQKCRDAWLGLTFGLAMGNHMTTVLLLPLIIPSPIENQATVNGIFRWMGRWRLDSRSLVHRLIWLGAGLLIYLTLPLRALSNPPVNWGNPVSLDNFAWLVSGRLYQGQLFELTPILLWERFQTSAGFLIGQFGLLGLMVGLLGLVVFFKPSRLLVSTVWIAIVFSVFSIGYATSDSFIYLIPACLAFAVWIGAGLSGLLEMTARRYPKIEFVIGAILLIYLFVQAGIHWPQVDASQDLRAEQFGQTVLAQVPTHAILFAKGDKAIFTMWYFLYALHERPDLAIVATDLLGFDWYQKTLASTYPDLALPGPFPFAETLAALNPERSACFIEYTDFSKIQCLPVNYFLTP